MNHQTRVYESVFEMPEIWRQTEGKITHLFVSLGTCGTVTGTSKFLRRKNANVKVIAVQPTPRT